MLLYLFSFSNASRDLNWSAWPGSWMARGNEKLKADFFLELFGLLYTRLQSSGSIPGKRFRCKGKLFSLDGSLIDLSMKVFPWADIAPKKADSKLHWGWIMMA